MRSLRVLSRLLIYPDSELLEHLDELKHVLHDEGLLKSKTLKKLDQFIDGMTQADLLQVQMEYVDLFDRGRAHCLHLFEHVHGESRLRGQAMVDLAERYSQKGLIMAKGELPDYLPLFLEYISICEPEDALVQLKQAAPIIAIIGEKLRRKKSNYSYIFTAIVELSKASLSEEEIQLAADSDLPDIQTLDELDKEWEEPEAFGEDCNICDPMPLQPTQKDKLTGASS